MTGQLTRLNQTVGSGVGLAVGDLGILELADREGPLTPSRLAELSGLSPATMTGVLDRLEAEGWIRRERDPDDRRKVNIFAVGRQRLVQRYYGGMQRRVHQICAAYTDDQLDLIVDFLTRVAEAGMAATTDLRSHLPG
jgi:DNA-binding MarR family transcriptional regulator